MKLPRVVWIWELSEAYGASRPFIGSFSREEKKKVIPEIVTRVYLTIDHVRRHPIPHLMSFILLLLLVFLALTWRIPMSTRKVSFLGLEY